MKHLYILLFLFLGTYFAFAQVPTYDILGRITWEVYPDGTTIHYEYEPGGNRFKKTTLACTPPLAAFSPAAAGLSVAFTNTTSNATSTTWDFGDGSTSSLANPTHIYAAAGNYTVTMTVANACTTSVATQVLAVTNQNCNSCAISNGLVACYPFLGNANDASGNNNHGTPLNGLSLAPDRFGNPNSAYQFDGIDDYISIPASTSLNSISQTGDATFCGWVKTINNWNGNTGAHIFCKASGYNLHYRFLVGATGEHFQVETKYLASTINLNGNTNWNFFVGVKNGNVGELYLNGQLIYSGPFLNDQWATALNAPLEIGRDAHGPIEYTNGYIDDISIYNRALTAAEIQTLYQVGTNPTASFTNVNNALTTNFTNTSLNATSYSWNFGDGTSSTLQNPSHTYASAGTYSVSLTVSNSCGTNTSTQSVTVSCGGVSGAVAQYPFNGNANDVSGNANHGTVNGATLVPDRNGNPNSAYYFNGNSYIHALAPYSGNEHSISVWFLANSTNVSHLYPTIYSFGNEYVHTQIQGPQGNSNDGFLVSSSSVGVYNTSRIDNNIWHHSVYTVSKVTNTQKLYIDGVFVTQSSITGFTPFNYLDIGSANSPCCGYFSDVFFQGYIDDISVYNRILTLAEIQTLSGATAPTANFTNINNGLTATFTNTSTNATTYSWNFGNGQTSTLQNPTITYSASGTYTVCLTASDGCGTNQYCAQVTVICTPPTVSITANIPVSCNGGANGSTTVSATGGIAPYTYTWNTTPPQYTTTATNLAAGTYSVTVKDAVNCSASASSVITQPTTALSAAASTQTNVSCNQGTNGVASVIANGGTSPYTYTWSTTPIQYTSSANNLSAGNQTVTVIDVNGCTATASTVVTQPVNLSLVTNVINATCNGATGSADAIVSGGVVPYTYTWNTNPAQNTSTATNLAAGNYSVVVKDANNCQISASVSITQPSAIVATISTPTNVSCNGGNNGSATVVAIGGASPYTYTWNTTPPKYTSTANTLTAGSYMVTVKDGNNCTATASVSITQPTILNLTTSKTNILCNGGANGGASVVVSGGTSPYTYTWNTSPAQYTSSINSLAAGTYTITVKDNKNCTSTASVSITQPNVLFLATTQTNISCSGGANGSATVTPSGGTSPYTYTWNTNPVQYTATINNLSVGNYNVIVKDANNCTQNVTVNITIPTALTAISTTTDISCFGGNNGTASVNVSGGTSPYSYTWNTNPIQTSSTAINLSVGNYIVSITDVNGCSLIKNVVINQPLNALLATISAQTNVSCNNGNNGAASILAVGGTAPYTYTWNTNPVQNLAVASGLSAGTYNCSVIDSKNCITNLNVGISEPNPLSLSLTSNLVSCFGGNNGTIVAAGSGGTNPYQYKQTGGAYSSNNVFSGLSAGFYSIVVQDVNNCTATQNITVSQSSQISFSSPVSVTNVSCNGGNNGTITPSIIGGTLPYTYSWNTVPMQFTQNASGLSAGTYMLSVVDANGCAANSSSINITQPNLLVNNVTSSIIPSCYGGANGSINTTTTGGTAPYTYTWNSVPPKFTSNANGLIAGTYTLTTVDSKGCIDTTIKVLSQPTAVVATSILTQNVSCNGGANGTITIVGSGGVPPYSYNINTQTYGSTNIFIGLAAANYIVHIKDANNCIMDTLVSVTQPNVLASSVSINQPLCFGNTASATINTIGGTSPYTYSWSSGQATSTVSNLAVGTYNVLATDTNGCTNSQNITITQPNDIIVSISATNPLCYGQQGILNATASGGVGTLNYSWSSGQITPTINAVAGVYTVSVTDNNGCSKTLTQTLTSPSAITASVLSNPVNCGGGNNGQANVLAVGGVSPYTYSWWHNGATTQMVNGLSAGNYTVSIFDNNNCSVTATANITEPDAPNIIISQTDAGCFGTNTGSADATIFGGYAPFSYSWSNGVINSNVNANIGAGVYYLTIVDATGCAYTDSVNISQSSPIQIFTNQINLTCYGASNASASALAINGASPYVYSWSNGIQNNLTNGLSAGNYEVYVTDASGCMQTDTVTILQPNAIIVQQSSVSPVCSNAISGSISVNATGGNGSPYSYSWNTGFVGNTITNIGANTYTVYVRDAQQCLHTEQITLVAPNAPSIAYSVIDKKCNGGENDGSIGALVISTIGETFTYSWSNGSTNQQISNLAAGNYISYITSNLGCVYIDTVTVSQPAPFVIVTNNPQPGVATANVVSGGTPPYVYMWYLTPPQYADSVGGLTAGIYAVIIQDANKCIDTANVVVLYSTSINPPPQWHPLWLVYPNPTKDNIFVAYEGNGAILRIYNPLGQEILKQIITSPTTQIDISTYSMGTYTIELSTKDETMKAIQKIIKE